MTKNQRIFADEYLIDRNATRAYKAAYPRVKSDNTAAVSAFDLLRNPKISAYIDEQLEKLSSEKVADAKEIMEYLTSVMRGETQSEIVVTEGKGEGVSEARPMEKRPEEKERLKAAELLCKLLGMFDRKEDGADNGVLKQLFEAFKNA